MQRFKSLSRRLAAVATVAFVVAFAAATAQAEVYSFNMDPPNTAEDQDTGDVIRMTGAGIFDTGTGEILTMGSFRVIGSDGAIIARGTWEATDFVDFASVGGPSPGLQTGVLDMFVTLFPAGDDPITDVPMTVVCNIHPGFDTGLPEGIMIGSFTEPTGGLTLFNLHQRP